MAWTSELKPRTTLTPGEPVGHYSSFILRLWVEPRDGLRWGLIQHVATRNKRRFSTMSEMVEFITEHSDSGDFLGPAFTEGLDPPDTPGAYITTHPSPSTDPDELPEPLIPDKTEPE